MSAHATDADAPGPPADHEEDHHRSRWPFVSAIGAGGLYVGVALALLGYGAGVVPPAIGLVLAVGGLFVVVAGLLGWVAEAYIRAGDDRHSRDAYVATMVFFLATDLGTFGAGFVYYAAVRVGTWPPGELPDLVGSLVLANTAILLASSVVLHVGHSALEKGHRRRFEGLLGLTVALGIVFLGGQILEYYEFVVGEGFTLASGVYASAFYGLTGLHGLHVALGVVLLAIVFVRARRGEYGPDRDVSIATVSLYWHFVDAVWLVLVAVLYVGAEVTI